MGENVPTADMHTNIQTHFYSVHVSTLVSSLTSHCVLPFLTKTDEHRGRKTSQ